MFKLPETYNTYKIIGIDPGLSTTGIAIFELNNDSICTLSATTLHVEKLYDHTGLNEQIHSDRTIRLYKLKQEISNIVNIVKPVIVVCEGPFYNRFRPMAYGSLVETISYIQAGVIEANNNIPFYTLQPMLVKKVIGAKGNRDKDAVRTAVSNNGILMNSLIQDINMLDEHSVDAIAIGYSYITLNL